MPLSVFEFVPEYAVEHELLQPPPRRLRLAAWPTAVVCGCAAAFLLLIGCSVFIAFRSAELLYLARTGSPARARVVACEYSDGYTGPCVSTPTDETIAKVEYAFGPDGSLRDSAPAALVGLPQPLSAEPTASEEPVDELDRPAVQTVLRRTIPPFIAIRYAEIDGDTVSSPVAGLSGRSLGLGLAVALLIAALTCAVCARFTRWLRRTVFLLRNGEVAVATILAKEIRESDLPRYYVAYGFVDAEGAPCERLERCTPEQWRRLEIGQESTVLYPSAQPSRSELYAHFPLRCA